MGDFGEFMNSLVAVSAPSSPDSSTRMAVSAKPGPGPGTLRILVVEPQKRLFPLIREYFHARGTWCRWSSGRLAGTGIIRRIRPDIVLLDSDLPAGKGIRLVKKVVASGYTGSIVVMTSPERGDDIVECLLSGADAVIEKPIPLPLLYARVNNLFRACRARWDKDVVFGDLVFKPSQHKAYAGDTELCLTPLEYDVLLCLARNARQVMSRDAISRFLLLRGSPDPHARPASFVYSHIKNIRKKLAAVSGTLRLQTCYGRGYRLNLR